MSRTPRVAYEPAKGAFPESAAPRWSRASSGTPTRNLTSGVFETSCLVNVSDTYTAKLLAPRKGRMIAKVAYTALDIGVCDLAFVDAVANKRVQVVFGGTGVTLHAGSSTGTLVAGVPAGLHAYTLAWSKGSGGRPVATLSDDAGHAVKVTADVAFTPNEALFGADGGATGNADLQLAHVRFFAGSGMNYVPRVSGGSKFRRPLDRRADGWGREDGDLLEVGAPPGRRRLRGQPDSTETEEPQ